MPAADIHSAYEHQESLYQWKAGHLRGQSLQFDVDPPVGLKGKGHGLLKGRNSSIAIGIAVIFRDLPFAYLSEWIVLDKPGPAVQLQEFPQCKLVEMPWSPIGKARPGIRCSHQSIIMKKNECSVGADHQIGLPHIGSAFYSSMGSRQCIFRRQASRTAMGDIEHHNSFLEDEQYRSSSSHPRPEVRKTTELPKDGICVGFKHQLAIDSKQIVRNRGARWLTTLSEANDDILEWSLRSMTESMQSRSACIMSFCRIKIHPY